MKKSSRNILIVLVCVFVVIGGFAAYGVYKIYSIFSFVRSMTPETPADIKEPRILTGGDFLTKKEFFKITTGGMFETIGKGSTIKDEEEREKFVHQQTAKGIYNFDEIKVIGYEIVAVGKFGGFVFDIGGELKREIVFDLVKDKIKIGPYEKEHLHSELDNIRIVQLETNKYGFLSFGSTSGVRVFDQNGHEIWAYGKQDIDLRELTRDEEERERENEKNPFVVEAGVGDLDNDGVSEYIVSKINGEIRAFDRDGNERWFQKAEYSFGPLIVADIDQDGKNELLEIGENIRNGEDGKIIREAGGDSHSAVLFAEDKQKKRVIQFCEIKKIKLVCADEKGAKFFEGEAPLNELKSTRPTPEPLPAATPIYHDNGTAEVPVGSGHGSYESTENTESIYKPKAVWVTLKKDKPKYLAVVGAYIGIPRANLYIYAPDGTLVYHELLPENAEAIAVLPGENGIESLLVGGKETIWKYGN